MSQLTLISGTVNSDLCLSLVPMSFFKVTFATWSTFYNKRLSSLGNATLRTTTAMVFPNLPCLGILHWHSYLLYLNLARTGYSLQVISLFKIVFHYSLKGIWILLLTLIQATLMVTQSKGFHLPFYLNPLRNNSRSQKTIKSIAWPRILAGQTP